MNIPDQILLGHQLPNYFYLGVKGISLVKVYAVGIDMKNVVSYLTNNGDSGRSSSEWFHQID